MVCEPNELTADISCFTCLSEKQLMAMAAYLLCQINVSGMSGVGKAGAGSPEGTVTASPGTTYLNTLDDSFWVKKTGTGNTGWIELIA